MKVPGKNLHFHWKRKQIRDQKGLWITSFLRNIAFSLINIFTAVYLYEFGAEKFLRGGAEYGILLLILYWFLTMFFVTVMIVPISNYIIREIGYRRSVVVSLAMTSSEFILLSLSDQTHILWLIFVGTIFKSIAICLYWVTYHTLFIDDLDQGKVGSAYGMVELLNNIGRVIAPLIGAAITVVFGFKVLFLVGVLFLIASGIPMMFLKHHLHFDEVSYKELWKWTKERRFQKFIVAISGHSVQERLYTWIWPVYVFIVIGSIEGIGAFTSLITFASVVITLIVSKLFDKRSSKKVQIIGVSGMFITWIGRLFAVTTFHIVIVDTIEKLFVPLSRTFFFGYIFKRGQGRQSFSFVVYWIFWEGVATILVLPILAIILLTFGMSVFWVSLIAAGAIGTGLSILIEDHK